MAVVVVVVVYEAHRSASIEVLSVLSFISAVQWNNLKKKVDQQSSYLKSSEQCHREQAIA